MKCLYIHPGMHPGSTDYAFIPMGVVGLVNLVREKGWEVRGINLPMELGLDPDFRLDARLETYEGVVLALIDLHWYVHSAGAVAVAEWVRKRYPDAWIVMGGMSASIFDLELLGACPAVDMVIRGDAERPLLDVVAALSAGAHPKRGSVANATVRTPLGPQRDGDAWRIEQTMFDALDYVTCDWLDNHERYLRTRIPGFDAGNRSQFWLEVGRGCFFNCTMCGGGLTAHSAISSLPKPMYRSTSRILDDLKALSDRGIDQVAFSHDLFGLRFPPLQTLLAESRTRGVSLGVYHEFWRLPDPAILDGAFSTFDPARSEVALSPETGNATVRKRNFPNKPFENEEFLQFVRHVRRLGPELEVYFAANLPFETRKTWEEALSLSSDVVSSYGLDGLTLYAGFLTIDPWSPMWSDPEAFEIRRTFDGFSDYLDMTRSGKRVAGYSSKSLSTREVADNLTAFREGAMRLRSEWTGR